MKKPTILIVEDERIIARDIEITLQRAGYMVLAVATSGEEAITLVGMTLPDLVLMDIVLRGELDGIETAERIHTKYSLPVIYLTAYADQSILDRARQTESIGYVLKPFNEKELLATIEVTLYQYRSQRQRAEDALRTSEERFSSAFEFAAIGMALVAQDGHLLKVNQALCNILGYTADELVGSKMEDFTLPGDVNLEHEYIAKLLSGEVQSYQLEKRGRHKQGKELGLALSISLVRNAHGNPLYFITQIQDVTEHKKAEAQLRKLSQAVEQNPAPIVITNHEGVIEYVNPMFTKVTGYEFEEAVGKNRSILKSGNTRQETYESLWSTVTSGKEWHGELLNRRKNGDLYWESISISPMFDPSGKLTHFISIEEDISARKEAEARILALNRLYATISHINQAIIHEKDSESLFREICRVAIEHGQYRMAWIGLLAGEQIQPVAYAGVEDGYLKFTHIIVQHEVLGRGPTGTAIREGRCAISQDIELDPTMTPWREEALRRGYHSSAAVPIHRGGSVIGGLNVYAAEPHSFKLDDEILLNQIGSDISFALDSMDTENERRIAEAALHERLKEITCLYAIHNEMGLDLALDDLCQRIVEHLVVAMQFPDVAVPVLKIDGQQFTTDAWHEYLSHRIHANIESHGSKRGELSVYYSQERPFILPEEQNLLEAITEGLRLWLERKQASDELALQMEQLRALRGIDQAIVTSLELTTILELLVDEAILQLHVDAVTILRFDSQDNTLAFAAGRGFKTETLRQNNLKIGEGLAGKALQERRRIHERLGRMEIHLLDDELADEEFVSYDGVPLIANGRVRGVLEVFRRSDAHVTNEWLNLLGSLAKLAAIAIDKVELFNDLQNSKSQLEQAYDTTLEGWARALDLRDRETEGHTRRVTEMAVQLAGRFGFTEKELLQIKRGSLLHDIGKMGIPDNILLKPGPLTEDEWQIMRKHPVYAYEMLSPIEYLKPMIEIPYCHHERWDGSGYPRSLKGEEIPLAARIFTVVDVWDALTSERPYRGAWSHETTLHYILTNSGILFDPRVVEVFVDFMAEWIHYKG